MHLEVMNQLLDVGVGSNLPRAPLSQPLFDRRATVCLYSPLHDYPFGRRRPLVFITPLRGNYRMPRSPILRAVDPSTPPKERFRGGNGAGAVQRPRHRFANRLNRNADADPISAHAHGRPVAP